MRERLIPMTKTRSAGGEVRAEYSRSWAETRILLVRLTDGAVQVHAAFETDCGNFSGEIDNALSRVSLDGALLCLDLSVKACNGTGIVERWQCRLQPNKND